MKRYDVTFLGHLCYDEVQHFDGSQSINAGGAALYGAMAAVRLGQRVAAVMMLAPEDRADLDGMRAQGIAVSCVDAPETTRVQVIHGSNNMDERRIVTQCFAGAFQDDAIMLPETAHLHLAGCNDHEFTVAFIRAVKANTSATLSTDMQSFVRYNDPQKREIVFKDDPNKQVVIALMDKVKLDILEAKVLTGTHDLEAAAVVIQGWGCPEVMITSAGGVLASRSGRSHFARFSNRSNAGRTGRGDTTFGAYLAARVEHDLPEALEIAAAVVSIKRETAGPFQGTLAQVRQRMTKPSPK